VATFSNLASISRAPATSFGLLPGVTAANSSNFDVAAPAVQ
jgi:hypothetical protein